MPIDVKKQCLRFAEAIYDAVGKRKISAASLNAELKKFLGYSATAPLALNSQRSRFNNYRSVLLQEKYLIFNEADQTYEVNSLRLLNEPIEVDADEPVEPEE